MSFLRHIFIVSMVAVATGALTLTVAAQGSDAVDERRKQLEGELDIIERQIAAQEAILRVQRVQSSSFERDLAIVEAEIETAKLSIRQRDIYIEQLTGQIAGKQETIGELNDTIERQKETLAELLRTTNEFDNISLVEVALSNQRLSAFFEDLDAFDAVQISLQESFDSLRDTRGTTEVEKASLEDIRFSEEELLVLQEAEKRQLEVKEAEKETLLRQSRGEEARYQAAIAANQKTASQIRAELFQLRGSAAIPFGEALDLAVAAEQKTGVRPAFLLAVITQETKLGENIGNCNLPEDPPEYKWYSIMHPDRDQPPYLAITNRLGIGPEDRPLSCKPGYGWGGAMGPAQFIPSTWVLYEARISAQTGNTPPDPWNPEDAFMASSLLLADNGADRGGYDAEWLAAQRYFAGWAKAEDPAYAFYGNAVMDFAADYQVQIDILNAS